MISYGMCAFGLFAAFVAGFICRMGIEPTITEDEVKLLQPSPKSDTEALCEGMKRLLTNPNNDK